MSRLNKRKQSIWEVTKERERQRKARKIQEERGWGSSGFRGGRGSYSSRVVAEDVTALGLLQRGGAAAQNPTNPIGGEASVSGEMAIILEERHRRLCV